MPPALRADRLDAHLAGARLHPRHPGVEAEIKYQLFTVKDPERLVLDLEGVEFGPALAELGGKVATGDPYIDKLRVGRNRPGVVRVVLDLKAEVKPQVFTLKPIGEYGHRLVLDIYPVVPPDPLAALIEADEKNPRQPETAERDAVRRPTSRGSRAWRRS